MTLCIQELQQRERYENITENPTLKHKNIMLLHPRFIPKNTHLRYQEINFLSPLFAHYTTEPPLPVTRSALTPKEFLTAMYLFLKKQQLFPISLT